MKAFSSAFDRKSSENFQISDYFNFPLTSSCRLTSLQNKGYVTKQPSPADKRAYYIIPTEKATTLVESAKTAMSKHLARLITGMGQEQFDTFVRLTEEANHILEEKGE